jgi:hypothetical protein
VNALREPQAGLDWAGGYEAAADRANRDENTVALDRTADELFLRHNHVDVGPQLCLPSIASITATLRFQGAPEMKKFAGLV